MEFCLHAQKLLAFALEHPLDRYACPLRNNLSDILRRNRLRDDRILDLGETGSQRIDLLLRLSHLAIADLRHLAVIADPLGIMSLNLVILHLLTLGLQLGNDSLFLVPPLAKFVALGRNFLKLSLYLVGLE